MRKIYKDEEYMLYISDILDNNEFKKLPYDYGAAIGYSMVLNDAKTLEDAINESVDDMKNKKIEQGSTGDSGYGKEA